MCGDGRHPPEEWGHLTLAQFDLVEGVWAAHIEADGLPPKDFTFQAGVWMDEEGAEVTIPDGVRWLNYRCFAEV